MNQEKLNHLAVLHVHQERTNELEIANDFVSSIYVTHDAKSPSHISVDLTQLRNAHFILYWYYSIVRLSIRWSF